MNPWWPASPCGRECASHTLPPVSGSVALRRWVAAARAATDGDAGFRARRLLRALGVRLDADAAQLSYSSAVGTLIVANHISWLDIVGLRAIEEVRFLAKREIEKWPLIGRNAKNMGTVFLQRHSLRTLPASVAELATELRAGHSIAVFPQGSTWCSGDGGDFRHACFQAALDARAPVRPVTLEYQQGERPSTVAAFVGADTLPASLRRICSARALTLRVRIHPALPPEGDRRWLATQAQHAVRKQPGPEVAGSLADTTGHHPAAVPAPGVVS